MSNKPSQRRSSVVIAAEPSASAAIAFLQEWDASGPWTLTAINPKGPGIETRGFQAHQVEETRVWLEERLRTRNLYFSVNRPNGLAVRKLKKTDIAAAIGLHVDVDPLPNADLAEEKKRIKKALGEFCPAPTVLINSGNGVNALWKFDSAVPLNNAADIAKVEDANRSFAIQLGADNCHNIDRILRLPGTLNLPTKKKRALGRSVSVASILSASREALYEADQLLALKASPGGKSIKRSTTSPAEATRFEPAQWCQELIQTGRARGRNYPSRSEAVFAVCCELARQGLPIESIEDILCNPANAISESILEKGAGASDYARRQAEQAYDAVDQEFVFTGKVIDSKASKNVVVALQRLSVELAYDQFARRLEVAVLNGFGPQMDDAAVERLFVLSERRFDFRSEFTWFYRVVRDLARTNSYHPVLQYLDGLTWDRQSRVDTWLIQYAGAEDTAYTRAVGRMLLVAAVRRVRQPGVKFDEMVVLEGEQGTGKSTALRKLAVRDEWFADDFPLDGDGKKVIEAIEGKWIVEAPELSGLGKANVEHLKATLSRGADRARRAYERLGVDVPRQSILVGTTNESSYLRDTTGNRRFLPIRIQQFDLAAVDRDRDQLWAEAVQLEKSGASIRLPNQLWRTAQDEQASRVVEYPFFEILLERFGDECPVKVQASQVWQLLDREPGRQSQADNKRMGEAMRRLGLARKRLRAGGRHAYWYVRGDHETAPPFEELM